MQQTDDNRNSALFFNICSEHVRFLRETMGITTDELARKTGISSETIRKIEDSSNGSHGYKPDIILRLADFFDVSIDYIVGRCHGKEYFGITDYYHDADLVRRRIAYETYLLYGHASSPAGSSVISVWPYNLLDDILSVGRKPEEKVYWETPVTDDQMKGLMYVLDTLKSRNKDMVILYYQAGNSQNDIARLFGITNSRAGQLIHKSVRMLRHPTNLNYIKYGYECYTELLERHRQIELSALKKRLSLENSIQDIPVDDLHFSIRICNSLNKAGIHTLGQIAEKTEEQISEVRNIGPNGLAEIRDKLIEYGLHFKQQ